MIIDTTTLTVSLSDAAPSIEGGSLTYTVTLNGGTSVTPITIPLTYEGTATPVLDFDRAASHRHHSGRCDERNGDRSNPCR